MGEISFGCTLCRRGVQISCETFPSGVHFALRGTNFMREISFGCTFCFEGYKFHARNFMREISFGCTFCFEGYKFHARNFLRVYTLSSRGTNFMRENNSTLFEV